MSRSYSSSARTLLRWLGFQKENLPSNWRSAVERYTEPGGGAEKKLGKVLEVYIKSRGGNPVHQSHFNTEDKNLVVSARVKGEEDTKTCHIYDDGTGTTKKGDERC